MWTLDEWKPNGKENEGTDEERVVLKHKDGITVYIYWYEISNNILAMMELITKRLERAEAKRKQEVAAILADAVMATSMRKI